MAKRQAIIKKLLDTANTSNSYKSKWLSDENWVELINHHHPNDEITVKSLNGALSRHQSTKDAIDLMDGTSNPTGIYRNKKFQETTTAEGKTFRNMTFYLLLKPGSDVQPIQKDSVWWDQISSIQSRTRSVEMNTPYTRPSTSIRQSSDGVPLTKAIKRPNNDVVSSKTAKRANVAPHGIQRPVTRLKNEGGPPDPASDTPFTESLLGWLPRLSKDVVAARRVDRKPAWIRKKTEPVNSPYRQSEKRLRR